MVSFEPLAIDEANAFLDESIREFVSERVPADHVDAGIEKMREDLSQRLMPNGILTSGHRFEAIISNCERVGRVWFGPLNDDESDLYICDISIAAERRREGHARAAVERILDHARSRRRRHQTMRRLHGIARPQCRPSGATAAEVADALGVAITMNGGPGTVHAPRAFEAFQEFAQ